MTYTEDELRTAVENSKSKLDMARKLLGYRPHVSKIEKIYKHAVELNLDTSHWWGLRGPRKNTIPYNKIPIEEILIENSTYKGRGSLRYRILEEGLLKEVCDACGLKPFWNGKPLRLHLDHINGKHTDNRIENLRFLCPNCHNQTETWGNKPNAKIKISDQEIIEMAKTMTNREIAKKLGVHDSTISHRIRKYYDPHRNDQRHSL